MKPNIYNDTPFHLACYFRYTKSVKVILNAFPDRKKELATNLKRRKCCDKILKLIDE